MKIQDLLLEAQDLTLLAPQHFDNNKRGYGAQQYIQMKDISVDKKGKILADFIKKNAQPYLSQINPQSFVLYRGTDFYRAPANPSEFVHFIQPSPTDRKPLDTGLARHRIFNMLIELAGGYADRSNAFFATRRTQQAGQFGSLFVVIPLGNFRYTYSTKWRDWTNYADEAELLRLFNEETNKAIAERAKKDLQKRIAAISEKNKRLIQDLKSYLKNPMSYSTYALMGYKESLIKKPKSYDVEKLKKVIVADRNLQYLEKGFEIMISTPKMLHIDYQIFERFVWPHLKSKK